MITPTQEHLLELIHSLASRETSERSERLQALLRSEIDLGKGFLAHVIIGKFLNGGIKAVYGWQARQDSIIEDRKKSNSFSTKFYDQA